MTRGCAVALSMLSAAALLGCQNTAPPKSLEQLTAHEARGHEMFQSRCAACHYDRVKEPLHGPPLVGVFQKKYLQSGAPANDERVTATVLHGHGLMPAQSNIDPQDLDDVLAYLHTL